MKQLSTYRSPKGMEVYYIKKFVNGVSKEEFEYMMLSGIPKLMFNLAITNVVIDLATKSINKVFKKK